MHLLTATPGTVSNGDEAIDLGQSPGDIVLLTVADSELACFASAAHALTQELGEARRASGSPTFSSSNIPIRSTCMSRRSWPMPNSSASSC